METTIWKDDLYLNPNIFTLFNKEIYEYDIHSAGYSITKEFQLLPEKEIEKLYSKDKQSLNINIGLYQRKDPFYRDQLKEGFQRARKRFFEDNELDEETVISIKKDAIFTTKKCKNKTFGEIDFRNKNKYSSYLRLPVKPIIELYYNPLHIDVKGLSDECIKRHESGILEFFNRYFEYQETGRKESVLDYLKRTVDQYKQRELPVNFYRPFNIQSKFMTMDDDILYDDFWEDEKDRLDITYNYFMIISKVIQLTL